MQGRLSDPDQRLQLFEWETEKQQLPTKTQEILDRFPTTNRNLYLDCGCFIVCLHYRPAISCRPHYGRCKTSCKMDRRIIYNGTLIPQHIIDDMPPNAQQAVQIISKHVEKASADTLY